LISLSQLEDKILLDLRESWNVFVFQLPVNFEAAESIPLLEAFGKSHFTEFEHYCVNLIRNTEFRKTTEFEDGMNSPGILWDRLTILNCKMLFTSPNSIHHKPLQHKSFGNVSLELSSVMSALNKSLPAKHILLAKEATDRQQNIVSLENSLWSLQLANIAMWINQDLLYTVSTDDVDSQRLKDYIHFFSKANRIRNTAIENIELYYIHKLQRK
jgi:hypothetical protein